MEGGSILGKLLVRYGVDTSELDGAQQKCAQTFNGIQEKASSTAKLLAGAAGLGGAIYATKKVVDEFASFEDAMQKVKVVSGATGEEFNKLKTLARDMAKETEFSASQIAQGMYELSSAGMNAAQQLSIMPAVLDLATAGGIEMSMAAEMVVKALGGFRLEANQASHVTDVFATAVNKSMLHFEDLAYAMKYIAPVAGATGQSIEDMVAAVGLMGNAGIRGEQAGTTLRATMVRLMDPTKEVADGMRLLGLEMDRMNPSTNSLASILSYLAEKSQGVDESTRNQAYSMIFGTEALSGMLALVNAGPGALQKLSDALKNSAGTAESSADEMRESFSKRWAILKNQLMDFGMKAAETLMPLVSAFMGLVEWVGGARNAIIMFASAWATIKIANFASSVGGLSGIFQSLTASAGGAASALAGVGSAFATFAAGGVVAAGAGVITYFWQELNKANQALAEAEARLKAVNETPAAKENKQKTEEQLSRLRAFAELHKGMAETMKSEYDQVAEILSRHGKYTFEKMSREIHDVAIAALADPVVALEGLQAKMNSLRLKVAEAASRGVKDTADLEYIKQLQGAYDELLIRYGLLPQKAQEAAQGFQALPQAVMTALQSQDPIMFSAGEQAVALYVAGLAQHAGEPPEVAASIGNQVSWALSSSDPAVQAAALEMMKNLLSTLVFNGQMTAEQAATVTEQLVTNMQIDGVKQAIVSGSYTDTLNNIINLLNEKKSEISRLANEIGDEAQRGLTVSHSPDISYKVPAVYRAMFDNLRSVFAANLPSLNHSVSLVMPAVAPVAQAAPVNQVHVHVGTFIGEERWVNDFADKLARVYLPRAGYGRWAYV